ncbi:g6599 [Coccomyxa viridis]|uniref:G6599 protein n=1 Tax=Coccomyxa viridis TaxID=1274662 RepID=A0ABP1G0Q5_9CHLO
MTQNNTDVVAMEDTLDKARQLRDEMVRECLLPSGSPARHIHKIYPEADSEALPDAVEHLLGACSACNLHTAIALVSKMRAMGIEASCKQLVMQPSVALERRKQQQSRQQIAYAAWPPSGARSEAGKPRGSKHRQDYPGWPSLPADILLQVAALVPDADVHVMACASASWRDALNRDIHSMSFTWAARDPRHGHVCAVNRVVQGAAVMFQNLHTVGLRRATHLQDRALAALAAANGPRLKDVDLSGCQLVTDLGIRALTSSCRNLESVNVSSCYELSDAAFESLGTCSGLRSLDACGCEQLTDAGLQALAQGARDLRKVNLGWCEGVTEEGVRGLAHCCSNLEVLDLCGCVKVRDMGVVAVALNCSKLTALGLHCCRRLTDASMAACALKLRHLSSLNISGCLSMSPAAVQAVIDANPGLHTCRSLQRTVIIGGCLSLLEVSCCCKRSFS